MNTQDKLKFYAARAARQIGTAYDIAKVLKIDYIDAELVVFKKM